MNKTLLTKNLRNVLRSLMTAAAILLAGLCLVTAQPRAHQVTGIVFDQDGMPMPGVTVLEKKTQNGTTTGTDGRFSINVASENSVLAISFVGMKTIEIGAGNGSELQITLKPHILDDVVIIGYGVTRKSDLTGSVSTLKDKDIQNRMTLSLEDALRGRLAGVTVSTNDGQPGESLNIRIRGTGSINASNSPLYVIDGVLMDEADINPGDVASIEVLKDASSTAIYGSRGANGVVLITTHKGTKGKPRINLSVNSGLQTPVRLLEMMNNWQYYEHRARSSRMYIQAGSKKAIPNQYVGYYDRFGNIWAYPTNKNFWNWREVRDDPDATNTDWQRAMLQDSWVHDIRLNISGGGEKNTYSVMASALKNNGMVLNSGFDKYTVRANFEQTVNRHFNFGFNVVGSKSRQKWALTNDNSGTIMNMLSQMPTKKLNFTDEWLSEEGESTTVNNNPWYQAHNVVRTTRKDNILGKLYLNIKFARNFRLNISGNYELGQTSLDQFIPKSVNAGRNANGIARNTGTRNNNWLNENLLYYTPKAWGRHKFDAMAGITFEEKYSKRIVTEGQNFEYEGQKENGMNNALTPINPSYNYSRTRLMSVLLRANYTFDNRYLFTASFRTDGSSRFGRNNKWAAFPSGAFAWRISEERFLKKVSWISNAKLRLSAGVSGNTAIPAYQTLPILSIVNLPMSGSADKLNFGTKLSRIANPNLKWETSTQYDAGLDLGLFGNRLTATVDLYYKQTRDLLLVESIPAYTGYTTRWSNVGAVDNKGLEISLAAAVVDYKDFKWNSSYNMSFNRSEVKNLGERNEMILSATGPSASDFGLLRVGLPIGTWYGYETDGLFRTQAEIDALPNEYVSLGLEKSKIEPGRQRYVDQNNDNVIDEQDRVPLGNSQPKFTGGWQNEFSYKGLTLMVAMEFSYGRKLFNATALQLEKCAASDNETLRFFNNRWTPTLYDMQTGEMVWQGNEDNSWLPGISYSGPRETYCKDTYIEDGSYLRISDLTISYDLPKRWVAKIGFSNLRIYAGIRNLWVFTGYTGYDPDVNSIGGTTGDLLQGVDNGSYPRSRIYSIGANISF